MKRIRFCSVLVILILISTAILAGCMPMHRTYPDAVQMVDAAERALYNEHTVILAHVDFKSMVALEEKLYGKADRKSIENYEDKGFLADLKAAGIDLRDSLERALYVLHVRDDEPMNTVILFGKLPADRIAMYLKDTYDVTISESGHGTIYEFVHENPRNCKKEKKTLNLADGRIVMGSSRESMTTVLEWLDTPSPKEAPADWVSYRAGKLAAVAVFVPKDAYRSTDGLKSLILKDVGEELSPVRSMFASAVVDKARKGVVFELLLNSDDQDWIAATSGKWRKAIDESRQKMSRRLESVDILYDALSVEAGEGRMSVSLTITREMREQVGAVIQELLASIFTWKVSDSSKEVPSELIEEAPARFLTEYSESSLVPFNQKIDMNVDPIWTSGPFAIEMAGAEFDEDKGSSLKLHAVGQNIENIGEGKLAAFIVSSIVSKDGREVMRIDTCGREKSQDAAEFESHFPGQYFKDGEWVKFPRIEATKNVGLVEGVDVADVGRIEGFIKLRLPVETETVVLPAPIFEKGIEKYGVRVFVNAAERNSIAYDVSGDDSVLLMVRAMNKDKQYLKDKGGGSGPRMFSSGKYVNNTFFGKVAYVEIVFARKFKDLEFPFVLDDAQPRFDTDNDTRILPEPVMMSAREFIDRFSSVETPLVAKEYEWQSDPQAVFRGGPLNVLLKDHRPNSFYGGGGTFEVQAPLVPGLEFNLSGVEVVVQKLNFTDGSTQDVSANDYVELKRDGIFSGGRYAPSKEKTYMVGSTNLRIDLEERGKTVKTLEGVLRLRLPSELRSVRADDLRLGKTNVLGPYTVYAQSLRSSGLTVRGEGPVEQLVRLQALNAEGIAIGRTTDIRMDDKGWAASISLEGRPEAVEVLYATEQESVEYPLVLEIERP